MNTMTALLPFVIMGIGLKIAAPHLKKREESFISTGIGFGVGLGLLVSSYVPSIPSSYGVSIGFLLGVLAGSNIKKNKN